MTEKTFCQKELFLLESSVDFLSESCPRGCQRVFKANSSHLRMCVPFWWTLVSHLMLVNRGLSNNKANNKLTMHRVIKNINRQCSMSDQSDPMFLSLLDCYYYDYYVSGLPAFESKMLLSRLIERSHVQWEC